MVVVVVDEEAYGIEHGVPVEDDVRLQREVARRRRSYQNRRRPHSTSADRVNEPVRLRRRADDEPSRLGRPRRGRAQPLERERHGLRAEAIEVVSGHRRSRSPVASSEALAPTTASSPRFVLPRGFVGTCTAQMVRGVDAGEPSARGAHSAGRRGPLGPLLLVRPLLVPADRDARRRHARTRERVHGLDVRVVRPARPLPVVVGDGRDGGLDDR